MSHRFCFTKWDDVPIWDEKQMDFLTFQLEKAPKTGKLHWQGYVEFKNKTTMANIKSIMKDNKMHIEVARGTTQQCIDYCTKADTAANDEIHEYGKPRPGQGTRTDLESDKKILLETKDPTQCSFGNFCRYNKAFDKFLLLSIQPRVEPTEVTVYWGKTNMGKSRLAFELGGTKAYWKNATKWWDGYLGQDTVIMNEFFKNQWDESYLRELWDRYPFTIEFKGGSCQFNSKKIIVTTNEDPNDWSDELKRRIKIVFISA